MVEEGSAVHSVATEQIVRGLGTERHNAAFLVLRDTTGSAASSLPANREIALFVGDSGIWETSVHSSGHVGLGESPQFRNVPEANHPVPGPPVMEETRWRRREDRAARDVGSPLRQNASGER